MKFIKTTLWALCVCLFVACGDDDDNNGNGGKNGGNNGGGETPTEKVTLMTEINILIGDKKLPYRVFTYDDNNQLSKAVENGYNSNGELDYSATTTLTRNGNTVTAIMQYDESEDDDEDAQSRIKMELIYDDKNNIIEKIVYASDDKTKKFVFTYTWADGKVIRIDKQLLLEDDSESAEVEFDAAGNAKLITISRLPEDIPSDNTHNSSFSFFVNTSKKTNFFSLWPKEYVFIVDGDGEEDFDYQVIESQCVNEISKEIFKSEYKNYNNSSKEILLSEYSTELFYETTYKYDDGGLPSEVIRAYSSRHITIDYENSDHDSETNHEPYFAKLYPVFVEKDKK
ncbi:hypothetical protein [Prevotella sp. 10(H)]|uniref:hypothetical protein n=1 Tax=Prevotella sp. 10(H) TaxID=1158294 RepID=UPI0004A6FBA8|nr:hypothetical protein [Prevotella sp. 10(H)]